MNNDDKNEIYAPKGTKPQPDKLIRCITSDGAVMAIAADTTGIVHMGKKLHRTSNAATAALGRLLTASSIMGCTLKQKNATVTLRVKGDGPIGVVVATADSRQKPNRWLRRGKINVGKAVGKDGVLNVMKDFGVGEPYNGVCKLTSGEIAEDITSYYALSEQIPTVCALGVLVDKDNGEVMLAGGMLIQLLPGATDETIEKLEENIKKLEPVTTSLAKGISLLDMVKTALAGFDVEQLDEQEIAYVCNCSKERVVNAIIGLSPDEIRGLADSTGRAKAKCYFCNKNYTFTTDELEEIIARKDK